MARGLLPVTTHSAHWLAHPQFADAVARFLEREDAGIENYVEHLEGRSLTDFVVTAAHKAAKRSIEQAHILRLSVADQSAFAAALIDPPKPNAALKRAFAKQRKLIAP